MPHVIALHTYGSQRVRAPSGATVSAYKIGYPVGRDVLLSLYGTSAQDVTPKHATYYYVSITGATCVHDGWLLLSLTDEELASVERYTRPCSPYHCRLWRWLDDRWQKFPNSVDASYSADNVGTLQPTFDPQRYRVPSPSGATQAEAIRAEKSERAGQTAWWWLTGDTYPHRDLLKQAGCRWSLGRKAWYYIGDTLPPAVRQLLTAEAPEVPKPPNDDIPQEAPPIPEAEAPKPKPSHQFELGQKVYSAHVLRLTPNLKLNADHVGQVVARYRHTLSDFSRWYAYQGEFAYRVRFEGIEGEHPVFEENLRAEASGIPRFQRDEAFPLIPGVPADEVVKLAINRRLELSDRPLLDRLQEAPPIPEAEAPPIRILKPDLSANDPLLEAVRQSKGVSSPATATRPHAGKLMPIGQKYVGELTGSIAGNVFCYGYAVHEDILLYLNLGGPRMAVEAIRARLAKGDIVNLSLWDAPAIELSAGDTDGKANTGMYTAYLHSIAEAKFTSALLVHEWLTAPTYGGKSLTGIFRTSDAQATAKLLHHVRQLVNVPVFEAWANYLYHVGQEAGLLRKPRCDGDIDLLIVDLDATAWTRLITAGLANGVIQLAGEKEVHV